MRFASRMTRVVAVASITALVLVVTLVRMTDGALRAEVNEVRDTRAQLSDYPNVWLSGVELERLDGTEGAILDRLASYCQAMVDADTEAMRSLVDEHVVFVHMSGRRQTLDEYLADIADGLLDYRSIGIESPRVEVDGGRASVSYTSVLEANAYGSVGTYCMPGTRYFERRDGMWIQVNDPGERRP